MAFFIRSWVFWNHFNIHRYNIRIILLKEFFLSRSTRLFCFVRKCRVICDRSCQMWWSTVISNGDCEYIVQKIHFIFFISSIRLSLGYPNLYIMIGEVWRLWIIAKVTVGRCDFGHDPDCCLRFDLDLVRDAAVIISYRQSPNTLVPGKYINFKIIVNDLYINKF